LVVVGDVGEWERWTGLLVVDEGECER
jgi:hypothetical protein